MRISARGRLALDGGSDSDVPGLDFVRLCSGEDDDVRDSFGGIPMACMLSCAPARTSGSDIQSFSSVITYPGEIEVVCNTPSEDS